MERLSTLSLMERIPDEAAAYKYLETLRWKGNPTCPHCGSDRRCYFLKPTNGPRTTSTGRETHRRLWKCAGCRRKFSVLTGTVMHGSKIPIRTWILVIFEMASNKNGVASREVERRYNLTPKSAWFLLHRIRESMRADRLVAMMVGTVVADEAFIGGKSKNRHRQGTGRVYGVGGEGAKRPVKSVHQKIAVLSLVSKRTGEVRSRVVPDVTGATLRKAIAEQVDMAASDLHTDSAGAYKTIGHEFASHQSVDHSSHEYVRGDVSTNRCENFFSQLKRSIDGTHHHVSREHLARYLGEFDFRYSTKTDSDTDRMVRMIEQAAGRRLTYRACR